MLITGLVGKVAGGNWLSRHSLMTAFFPNLAFWIVIVALLWKWLVPGAKPDFTGFEATAWSFLFIVWVVALTFFSVNLQPAWMRLLRGDWGWKKGGFPAFVFTELRDRARREIFRRNAADRDAASKQEALDAVADRIETLMGFQPDAVRELSSAALRQAFREVAEGTPVRDRDGAVVGSSDTMFAHLEEAHALLTGTKTPAEIPAAGDPPTREDVALRLRKAAADILEDVRLERSLIESDRQWEHDATKAYVPTHPAFAGPTRLGNVFRTTEEALVARYGLRPWLLASHLRMALPAGYAESLLDDARIALDLSATLSAMAIIYGTVLGICVAIQWPDLTLFTVTMSAGPTTQVVFHVIGALGITAVVLGASLLGTNVRGDWKNLPWYFAGITLLAMVGTFFWQRERLEAALGGIAIVVLLMTLAGWGSRMAYLNAVEAAVIYCENIKTLFDNHRSRILTGMRLRIPATIQDERQLWRQISQQLDRAYSGPLDPRFVSFTTEPATTLPAVRDAAPPLDALGARRPLDALAELKEDDLKTVRIWGHAAGEFFTPLQKDALIGRRIVGSVSSEEPILAHQLLEKDGARQRVVCAVPAAARALVPDLRAGDRISMVFKTSDNGRPDRVDDLIVSAVTRRASGAGDAASSSPAQSDTIVTVLVPLDRLEALAGHVASGSLPAVAVVPSHIAVDGEQ